MDFGISFGPLALVALALVDSTSVGTLVIPVMLLVTGEDGARRTAVRTALFLLVIGAFYAVLGVLLLAGLLPILDVVRSAVGGPGGRIALAVIGAGLVLWSFWTDPAAVRRRGGDPEASGRRWMERVQAVGRSPRRLAGLAVLAGTLEAASMVPYLAAMGMIARAGLSLPQGALVLLGYCAVMVTPGLLLAGGRVLAGARADRALRRLQAWASRQAQGAFSWAIGIIGAIVALRAIAPFMAMLH